LEYAASFSSGCSYCLFNTLNHCILTHHVHLAAPQVRHPRRWLRSQLVLKQPRPLHADGQRQGRHGHRLLCEIPPLYLRPCRLKPFNSQPGAILKLRNRLHGCSLELAKTAPEGCKPEGSAAACTGCGTSRSARLLCFCYVLDRRKIASLLLCWKACLPFAVKHSRCKTVRKYWPAAEIAKEKM
jgi:hypothetical protein